MTEALQNTDSVEHAVQLLGISKQFGDNVIYADMALRIRRGETMTIIGGSGQGKSVCMKMIIGLLRPDRGQVLVGSEDVAQMAGEQLRGIRRRVAYVFQGGALFDSMNILDNVGYALREHTDMSDTEIRGRVMECLEMVGLSGELCDAMPANLSVGMRKRVALARSIALRPEVILYDEPTTGLDPRNIGRIGEMIMKLQRELNVTSVVVTHDMPMAFKVSDRIAMLYEHHFPFVDTASEIENSENEVVRDFVQGRIEDG